MLQGKVVLVTGASRGLGRAAALIMARHGASVVAAARSEADLQSLAMDAASAGSPVLTVVADVADPQQVASVYERIDAAFGRIDIVVNNAGFGLFTPLESHTPADLDALLAVNFKGTFYSCQQAFRRMKRTGGGHIVNVISTSGKLGRVNEAGYTSAKWAVSGLTECLKLEGKPYRIRATAFCPGGMETAFWDSQSARAHRSPNSGPFMPPEAVAGILVNLLELPDGVLVDDITIRRT